MLTQFEIGLLRRLVSQRDPSLAAVVRSLGRTPLTDDQREALREVLLQEMLERGLGAGDEANAYGRQLDDIIGRLRHY
jgi:hypothetical protein